MMGAQMGKHNRSVMVVVLGPPCGISPHNCNNNTLIATSHFKNPLISIILNSLYYASISKYFEGAMNVVMQLLLP
jgi:hypothetical protein